MDLSLELARVADDVRFPEAAAVRVSNARRTAWVVLDHGADYWVVSDDVGWVPVAWSGVDSGYAARAVAGFLGVPPAVLPRLRAL